MIGNGGKSWPRNPHLRQSAPFLYLPDKPFKEVYEFHCKCDCKDINNVKLKCQDYFGHPQIETMKRFGYYIIKCHCDTCKKFTSSHKFVQISNKTDSIIQSMPGNN